MRNQDIKLLLKRHDSNALIELFELLWSQERGKTELENSDSDFGLEVSIDWNKLQKIALSPTPREVLQYWISNSKNWLPSGITVAASIISVVLCKFAISNLAHLTLMEQIVLIASTIGLVSITLLMLIVGLGVLWTQLLTYIRNRRESDLGVKKIRFLEMIPMSIATTAAIPAVLITILGLSQIGTENYMTPSQLATITVVRPDKSFEFYVLPEYSETLSNNAKRKQFVEAHYNLEDISDAGLIGALAVANFQEGNTLPSEILQELARKHSKSAPLSVKLAIESNTRSAAIDSAVFDCIASQELEVLGKSNGLYHVATRNSNQIFKQMQDNPSLLEYFRTDLNSHDADSLLGFGLILERVRENRVEALRVYIAVIESDSSSSKSRIAALYNARRLLANSDILALNEAFMTVLDNQPL